MIKATDLRIGNLCWDIHSKELLKVTDLSEDQPIGFTVINRDKYPLPDGWQAGYIPLTPDWLERCGFEDGKLNDFKIGYDNEDFVHQQMSVPFDGQLIKVKYLHRLQNLYFALTGEELTIKETV